MGNERGDGRLPAAALKGPARPALLSRWWIAGLLVLVLGTHAVHLPLLFGSVAGGQVPAAPPHSAHGPAVTSGAGTRASSPREGPGREAIVQDGAQANEATVSEWCLFEAICAAGRNFPTPVFAAVAGLALPAFHATLSRVTSPGPAGAASGRRRRAWLQVYLN